MPMHIEKPRIHISSKLLPEIKKWKIGKTYKVEAEIEQTSLMKSDMMGDTKDFEAGFIIKSIKPYATS